MLIWSELSLHDSTLQPENTHPVELITWSLIEIAWNSAGWVKHEPQKAKPQQIRALLNPFQAPEPFRPTRPWRGYPQKGVGWKQTPWPNKKTRAACVPHGGAKLRSVEASGARKYRHCLSDTDSLIEWFELGRGFNATALVHIVCSLPIPIRCSAWLIAAG